ncbi:SIS domain-containing protein [Lyngbya sp. PCC 8106]|uniref:SIS domain-containing protein n=1 Tax=Lyngbya sp. (strain PCC 8106) TaxID=313612 RepID=UPI0000EA9BDC|nr:SIS domain-containing protein [Lyngbya sp. PCC 8106]EAW37326.1 glucosamine--fructose-6-phosphate aminotransferase-related protein [Lyngbya sp. PCC 8106]
MSINSNLAQEIQEQPQALNRLLDTQAEAIQHLAEAIQHRQITHIVIAARGSSDNAARYALYLFGTINQFLVTLAAPSLYTLYNRPPQIGNALVLGISQSGESPDLVEVLASARQQGALTAAMTNISDSPLAQQADHVINLSAGVERSIAATKTYTAELLALAMLSSQLAANESMLTTLRQVPQWVEQTFELNPNIYQTIKPYCQMRRCIVIGRGYNYSTAFELALKLKELTYTLVEPYSSADFLHGPSALIEPGFPIVVIAVSGPILNEMQQDLMPLLIERGAEIITLGNDPQTLSQAQTTLPLPNDIPEWLSPICAIVPGQLFALHIATMRGYDVDQPRGLKKVTKTQ